MTQTITALAAQKCILPSTDRNLKVRQAISFLVKLDREDYMTEFPKTRNFIPVIIFTSKVYQK